MFSTLPSQSTALSSYISAKRKASALHASFFAGAGQAPEQYNALGDSVHSLSFALQQLVEAFEARASVVVSQNEPAIWRRAGQEWEPTEVADSERRVLELALDGVEACLDGIEEVLSRLHVDRYRDEKWWAAFVKLMPEPNGFEVFRQLADRVGYHVWAIDLVMGSLHREEYQTLLSPAKSAGIAIDLDKLLYSQLAQREDEDPILGRFKSTYELTGGSFFSDAGVPIVIRTAMFWTFKAVVAVERISRDTRSPKSVPGEGYVNLIKATWMLQKLRQTPWLKVIPDELRAVVTLDAMKLLAAFQAFAGQPVHLPSPFAINAHGDFRILLDDDATRPLRASISSATLGRRSSTEFSTISTTRSSTAMSKGSSSGGSALTDPALYYEESGALKPPSSPPPSFPPPTPPIHPGPLKGGSYQRLAINNRMFGVSNLDTNLDDFAAQLSPLSINEHPISRTPVSPLTAFPSPDPRTSPLSFREWNQKSPSPVFRTDSASCESPTLGDADSEGERTPPAPSSKLAINVKKAEEWEEKEAVKTPCRDSSQAPEVIVYPWHESTIAHARVPDPISEKEVVAADAIEEVGRGVLSKQSSGRASEKSSSTSSSRRKKAELWNLEYALEYGARLGERELMPKELGFMLQCSTTCDAISKWEDCIFRLFQNNETSEFRLLTVRENKPVDQRFLPLDGAELVPEYGYHENEPVIYLRKAGQGLYSLQSGPGNKGKSFKRRKVGDIQPASFYFKFFNIYDMFNFQLAFLGESVEADVRAIRSIKYTRGFRDSEIINSKARIQLWKQNPPDPTGRAPFHANARPTLSNPAATRSTSNEELIRVNPTRLVLYLDGQLLLIYVTDDTTLIPVEGSADTRLKLKPSSHRKFNNPTTIRVCVFGSRGTDKITGGLRLDKLGFDSEDDCENWHEYKSFEMEFWNSDECHGFFTSYMAALKTRRRERRLVEDVKRKASRGVKRGEW